MAEVFEVSYLKLNLEISKDEDSLFVVLNNYENINKINRYFSKINIKRGDIINTYWFKNIPSNDGKFIWDENSAMPLDYSENYHGNIPKNFLVSKNSFSPDYWRCIILYTGTYYPDSLIREEVIGNLKYDDEFSKKKAWNSFFMFGSKKYIILMPNYKENIILEAIREKSFELISEENDENNEYNGDNISVINF